MPIPDPRFVAAAMIGGAIVGALGTGASILGQAWLRDYMKEADITNIPETIIVR